MFFGGWGGGGEPTHDLCQLDTVYVPFYGEISSPLLGITFVFKFGVASNTSLIKTHTILFLY